MSFKRNFHKQSIFKRKNPSFKFEKDVADFSRKNFNLKVISPTGDGGKDIEGLDDEGNIVLISCKCYSPDNKIDRSKLMN